MQHKRVIADGGVELGLRRTKPDRAAAHVKDLQDRARPVRFGHGDSELGEETGARAVDRRAHEPAPATATGFAAVIAALTR
jgi:hypothetical protein